MNILGKVLTTRLTWCLLLLLLLIVGLQILPPTSNANQVEPIVIIQDDDAAEIELQKGTDLLKRRRFEDALKSFKRANDLRSKNCAQCLYGMTQAYFAMDAHKTAAETADKLIAVAGEDKLLMLYGYNVKGLSLQAMAEGKNQKKLSEAEAALRSGLALDASGQQPLLRFNLGYVLMQLNRDAEGVAEFKRFLEAESEGRYAELAAKMIENPRRAREPYAPDFSIVTAEGEHISSEDLRGKVVVLDFWGTWCPPCVDSIPSLRSLHKKFSKEPSFVLIGISSDSDQETWSSFITKEKMVWPQYLDRKKEVQGLFGVRAFPTYIVIDHEGIMRFRSVGTSWERSAYLNDAIKKYVKIVAKTDAAN
jgi:peroxiredoxin